MKALLIFIFVFILFNESYAEDLEDEDYLKKIDCTDFKNLTLVGSFLHLTSVKKNINNTIVELYLSTNEHKEPVKINSSLVESLKEGKFDPSKKSIFIIHGYRNTASEKWVLNMKDKLLEVRDANVFMVDWSNEGSITWNYVNAARKTHVASRHIADFLERLKSPALLSRKVPKHNVRWHHLYFIGHSLGAHLSGQIAYLLKKNAFWTVERITGLDPAQPCFLEADSSIKLNKDDADFVDIIHTQTGNTGNGDAFGLKQDLGHMDFYINGGVLQPKCVDNILDIKLKEMICSHQLAVTYFIESIENLMNATCKFLSYPWNGDYQDASIKSKLRLAGELDECTSCPTMGIEASTSEREGKYIVFTGRKEPYCVTEKDDYIAVKKAIQVITEKPATIDSSLNLDFHTNNETIIHIKKGKKIYN